MIDEYEFRKQFRRRFVQLVERDGRKLSVLERENKIYGAVFGNYRDGRSLPGAYKLYQICQIYNVSPAWLLGLSEEGRIKADR